MVAVLACSQTRGGRLAAAIARPTARVDLVRFLDQSAILGRVAAIDTPPGQVDDDIRSVNFRGPIAERFRIPADDPPRSVAGMPAQDDDLVTVGDERSRQNVADLAGPSREDDLHGSSLDW